MRTGMLAALGAATLLVAGSGAFADPLSQSNGAGQFPGLLTLAPSVKSTEGLAVDKTGNVYLSVVAKPVPPETKPRDQIWVFSPSGEPSVYADFGTPSGGRCGLAVDPAGNVYMARHTVNVGVYRVARDGGITLVPGTDQIKFPNALAFDQRGNLYVTETNSFPTGPEPFGPGGIWRVPKDGVAQPWQHGEMLSGTMNPLFGAPIGANGIAFFRGALYVANTDKGTIVRVAVQPDGSPGAPEVWAEVVDQPEFAFYGSVIPLMIDGLAFDVHGNAYVAVISRAAVVRIDANTKEQTTIAFYNAETNGQTPLDAPVNLAFGTGKGERQNLFISSQGVTAGIVYAFHLPNTTVWPGPCITKIPVGVPGEPLP